MAKIVASLPKKAIAEAERYYGLPMNSSMTRSGRIWYDQKMRERAQKYKQIAPPSANFNFCYNSKCGNKWYVTHDDSIKHVITTAPTFKQLLIKMEILGWPRD